MTKRDEIDQLLAPLAKRQRVAKLLRIEGLLVQERRDHVELFRLHTSSLQNFRIGCARRALMAPDNCSRNCKRVRWMRDRTASGDKPHTRAISR